MIETQEDAIEIAETLLVEPRTNMRNTSISAALDYARQSLDSNDFIGLRRIVDVSGDGPNNAGRPVLDARADLISSGATINGLPLMTHDGTFSHWHLEDLDAYYRECVIGGPGAFLIPVRSWDQFPEAVKRKLYLEIAQTTSPAEPRAVRPVSGYDCMIGEKIRIQRRLDLDSY